MNKLLAVIGTIICVLIAAALIKVLVSFTGFKTNNKKIDSEKTTLSFNWNKSVTTTFHEVSFPTVNEIKTINAELSSEAVTFEKTSDSEIKVCFMGNWTDITPHADLNNGELKIYTDKRRNILSVSKRSVKILVPAYKNDFSEIKCEIASGSIHVNGFASDEFELYTASGSIKLSDCTARETDVNSASGSITFENCNFRKAEVKAASGSLHFTDCSIPYIEAKSASGSIHISGSYDGMDIHSSSGSIHADLEKPLVNDSYFDSSSGSIYINLPKNSNFKLKYKCSSGTMKNEFTGADGKSGTDVYGSGNPLIEAYTTSGSIRINRN